MSLKLFLSLLSYPHKTAEVRFEMAKGIIGAVILAGMLTLPAANSAAQAVRVSPVRTAPATAVSSLSISVTPSNVHFQLVSKGVAIGSAPVNITTSWSGTLCLFTCTINVYGYFVSSGAALSGGSPVVDIPSSEVLGEVTTGIPTSYTAFTQSNPLGGAGASLELLSQSFFLYSGTSSRTDALSLEINLASQPQLPAGSYSGTLYIEAQSL
ncbi:MAG: hypothetical protein WA294_14915 [Acidobacteriaceae bacterium]